MSIISQKNISKKGDGMLIDPWLSNWVVIQMPGSKKFLGQCPKDMTLNFLNNLKKIVADFSKWMSQV